MITTAGGDTYRTADELNLQYYIDLAAKQVGKTHELRFQSRAKRSQNAGEFEIIGFEEKNAGWKMNDFYLERGQEVQKVITGADLGTFTIQLHNTEFYREKIMRFKVQAYVQDKNGINDHLFVSTVDEETGKKIKAYMFPVLIGE